MTQAWWTRASLRLAAILLAAFAFAQCSIALVLAGPHSDVPDRPVSNALVILLSMGLYRVALAAWRKARVGTHRR